MLSSHLTLHRRLDELALDALGPPPQLPSAADSYASIEVVWEDEAAIDELAATGRFVRFSAPYERVEIEEMPSLATLSTRPATFAERRPTTFVQTVPAAQHTAPASATVPFERVWFDDDEDRLAAIEEKPVEWKAGWWWLAISLAAGGVAVACLAIAA